jgi:hypothetical protein
MENQMSETKSDALVSTAWLAEHLNDPRFKFSTPATSFPAASHPRASNMTRAIFPVRSSSTSTTSPIKPKPRITLFRRQ